MATHASWFDNVMDLDKRKQTIAKALKTLRAFRKRVNFDAIAFRGMSGAILAPILADRLNVKLLVVRKEEEKTHSDFYVEGSDTPEKYVIVDDFVSSGDTIRITVRDIADNFPQAKFVGLYLYQSNVYNDGCARSLLDENFPQTELLKG